MDKNGCTFHPPASVCRTPTSRKRTTYIYIYQKGVSTTSTNNTASSRRNHMQATYVLWWLSTWHTNSTAAKNYNQLRRDWLQARSVAAQLSVAQLTKTNRQMRKKRLVYRFYLSKLGVKMVNTGQITVQCSKLLNCYKVCRVGFNVTLDTTGHFRMILRTIWPDQPSHSSAEGHSLVNQWLGQGPVHEKVKQRM